MIIMSCLFNYHLIYSDVFDSDDMPSSVNDPKQFVNGHRGRTAHLLSETDKSTGKYYFWIVILLFPYPLVALFSTRCTCCVVSAMWQWKFFFGGKNPWNLSLNSETIMLTLWSHWIVFEEIQWTWIISITDSSGIEEDDPGTISSLNSSTSSSVLGECFLKFFNLYPLSMSEGILITPHAVLPYSPVFSLTLYFNQIFVVRSHESHPILCLSCKCVFMLPLSAWILRIVSFTHVKVYFVIVTCYFYDAVQ